MGFLVLLCFWQNAYPASSTKLVPGLTYFDGKEKLEGRIVFLVSSNSWPKTNVIGSAAIMEFDLARKSLRQITPSCNGYLIRPDDGRTFCVNYDFSSRGFMKADIYSAESIKHHLVSLPSAIQHTLVFKERAFFWCWNDRIVEYDMTKEVQRVIPIPGGAEGDGSFRSMHTHKEVASALFFQCSPDYRLPKNKRPFEYGFYSYDFNSGQVKLAPGCDYGDGDGHGGYMSADGRYVFFEGKDRLSGYKLVSSPGNSSDLEFGRTNKKEVKVLKVFSKFSAFVNPYSRHTLKQMSPDGHYALVCYEETGIPNSNLRNSWVYSYYIVSCSTGDTRLLLKNNVTNLPDGDISELYWLNAATDSKRQ